MFQFTALFSLLYEFKQGSPPKAEGLSHSEISGSKVGQHLTGAFRSYPTSFINFLSQGIHQMLLFIELL
jgi:hypothetical protein